MGSPLSSIIAEIFLQEIDKKTITIINTLDPNSKWYRYVDDGLYIYISNYKNANSDKIIKELNNIHPNIIFTEGKEINKKLNYLDLTITRETKHLKYRIYRKPTKTSLTIPYESNHTPLHKMAVFHSLFHKLYNTPMDNTDTIHERNIIYQIANENGYPRNTINIIENKIKYKLRTAQLRNNNLTNNLNDNASNNDDNNSRPNTKKWATFTFINNKMKKI